MANPDVLHVLEFTIPSAGTTAVGPLTVPFAGEVVDVRAKADGNVASATVNVKQNGNSIGTLSFSGGTTSNVLTVTPGVANGTNYGVYSGKTIQSSGGVGDTSNQPPATAPVAVVAAGDLFTVTPSAAAGANVSVAVTVRKY